MKDEVSCSKLFFSFTSMSERSLKANICTIYICFLCTALLFLEVFNFDRQVSDRREGYLYAIC